MDDTILFSSTGWEEVVNFEENSKVFSNGLRFEDKLSKSILVGLGCAEEIIQRLADRLNCRKAKIPFQYLGLPIEPNPKSLSTWDLVIEKFVKQLFTWKRQYLSFGGRTTLIKSSL